MEAQLKQQRIAMQQKRLQDQQKVTTTSVPKTVIVLHISSMKIFNKTKKIHFVSRHLPHKNYSLHFPLFILKISVYIMNIS